MITTLTGANSFQISKVVRDKVDAFLLKEGDMGLERLDGDEVSSERLSEALTSLPFLSNKKLVLIRSGANNKQFAEQIQPLLSGVPETTDVLLIEPKLDKRSSYYKYLKKTTDYQEYAQLDPHGLARWIVAEASVRGGHISQQDAAFLVTRVGQNQQLLSSELDKLLLFAPRVTKDSILALTEATPQSTVFELLEAAFAGNSQRALALYAEQRALKVEPQQIIAMLSWQLHILALIKTAGDRSAESIASDAKVSPYVVKKSLTIANRLSLPQLKTLIHSLVTIDRSSKTETYNVNDALQYFILTLN